MEKGKIANLSAGGCYVKTESTFEVGEPVEMTLHVNKMSFRVTGSVVHVPPPAGAGDGKAGAAGEGSGMGVQFRNMSAGSRDRLKELIGDLKIKGESRLGRRTEDS
jgi:Tfp pilus assembly protein PilZ